MIRWYYFPKSDDCPRALKELLEIFKSESTQIDSSTHEVQPSDEALSKLRPALESAGYLVEASKKKKDKIHVPVLFGLNGEVDKYFEADARHVEHKIVLEVEAGRAFANYQFLKDIFQASVMYDVEYLAIAVRNTYQGNDDFRSICQFLETLYASSRLNLPLKGILIIGY